MPTYTKLQKKIANLGRFSIALSLLFSVSTYAADYCKFYSDDNWSKDPVTYELPNTSPTGLSWGAISVRKYGSELPASIYENTESVVIRAMNSDVVLYVYDGDNFDGNFQATRVGKGNTGKWVYGTMKNKVRSFICQRDDFISANQAGGIEFLMKNRLLPTFLIADPLTAVIHESVRKQKDKFYNLDLKRGRISWSTRYNTCKEIDCASPKTIKDKYTDFLKYQYKSVGRLKADGKKYDMNITLWIKPKLKNGELSFKEMAYKVDVSNWIWHDKIKDGIADELKVIYPTIGSLLTSKFHSSIRDLLGNELGNSVINGNKKLILSHPCNYYLQRVGYPDHEFDPFEIENFCGGSTPSAVAAPGIRLLR